jgi:hypothetical protein
VQSLWQHITALHSQRLRYFNVTRALRMDRSIFECLI